MKCARSQAAGALYTPSGPAAAATDLWAVSDSAMAGALDTASGVRNDHTLSVTSVTVQSAGSHTSANDTVGPAVFETALLKATGTTTWETGDAISELIDVSGGMHPCNHRWLSLFSSASAFWPWRVLFCRGSRA
jgi:hypothetical protein